jgi:hypothetical protein
MFQIYTAKPNACAGRRNGNNKSTATNHCFVCHIIFFQRVLCTLRIHMCCSYKYFVRISEDKRLPFTITEGWPIPVATLSKAWVCGRSLAEIAGSNTARGMDIFYCECCVLSGRGLCIGLITRLEESYRVWCV